ncbi:MAG: ABC transporter ATP-binding protein [Treponema sp.]|nr:ABC transporter ATP-binding protein [Treponema sp.]
MKKILSVENLSVGLRRNREWLEAVRNISFSIREAGITGLVGESGCGKSLTALSITGLLPEGIAANGGKVYFDGEDLLRKSEQELCRIRGKDISMIFQEPAESLNPLLKAGFQIGETLALHGEKDKKRIRAEVLRIMGELGLPDPEKLFEAYPHQLSGGMCQRVMIALAMINRPRLLIADEPATAVDMDTQSQILELLKKLNRTMKTAILYISHDLSVVRKFCDRVLVMYAGKIVELGSAEEVFSHPLHPYTRALSLAVPGYATRGKPLAGIPGKVPSIEEKFSGCPFSPRCGLALDECRGAFPEGRQATELPADLRPPPPDPRNVPAASADGEEHIVYCRRPHGE